MHVKEVGPWRVGIVVTAMDPGDCRGVSRVRGRRRGTTRAPGCREDDACLPWTGNSLKGIKRRPQLLRNLILKAVPRLRNHAVDSNYANSRHLQTCLIMNANRITAPLKPILASRLALGDPCAKIERAEIGHGV
jgi:hypothetical protein